MATQAQIDALMTQAQTIQGSLNDYIKNNPAQRPAAPAASPKPVEDPFITQLKAQMTGQQGIVSSAEQDVSQLIKDAQANIVAGNQAGAAKIESQFEREKGYQKEQNIRTITTAVESQRGFATNNALLRQIREEGDKSIKDLEQRKQELILSGNAAAAQQLSGLQLKEAEFLVQSRQQVFQNLISMAGVGLQAGSLQLQKEQFEQSAYQFERGQAAKVGEIALQYGVNLAPGDTLESVINKAIPRADEMSRLALEDAKASILLKRAQAAAANASAARDRKEMSTDIDAMAKALQIWGMNSPIGQGILETAVKSGNTAAMSLVLNELGQPKAVDDTTLRQKAMWARSGNTSIGDYIESIRGDTSIANKQRAEDIARLIYGKPEVPSAFMTWARNTKPLQWSDFQGVFSGQ